MSSIIYVFAKNNSNKILGYLSNVTFSKVILTAFNHSNQINDFLEDKKVAYTAKILGIQRINSVPSLLESKIGTLFDQHGLKNILKKKWELILF